MTPQWPGTQTTTTADHANFPAWQPPEIIRDLGDDAADELLAELVDAFCADTSERLHRLREAVAHTNAQAIRKEAHSIKGSALQMGADAMASLCQEIELAAASGLVQGFGRPMDALHRSFDAVQRLMIAYSFASFRH
jgi:HPt (histidine-containing phosphotransfer) domain-containing protein